MSGDNILPFQPRRAADLEEIIRDLFALAVIGAAQLAEQKGLPPGQLTPRHQEVINRAREAGYPSDKWPRP